MKALSLSLSLSVIGIAIVGTFFIIILSTLLGGLVGFVIGLVFPFVIDTLNQIAGTSLSGFGVGAVLGFIGGFFKNPDTK